MPTAKTPNTIQCFKPGRHVAMSGAALAFAASDLAACAAAYNPALHEAPLVVGHPQLDGPAYGWVRSVAFAGGALEAEPHQVNPEFAELVNAGSYKKVSAAFWAPDAPGNPVPGVYYLRHVGFLGAAAPAVKGLRTPEFAGGDAGVVEFSEWDDVDNASLWRGLRDWLLGKFGQAEADTAVPAYLVSSVERGAQQELIEAQTATDVTDVLAQPESAGPAFSNPAARGGNQLEITAVTPEQKAALEAENAALRQRLADQDKLARTQRMAQAHGEAVAFADNLVQQGRLPVGRKNLVVAVFDALASASETQGAQLAFAASDEPSAQQVALVPELRALLTGIAPSVSTERHATAGAAAGAGAGTVAFAAPEGTTVDQSRLALHSQAVAYQRANPGTDYVAAVKAVQQAA